MYPEQEESIAQAEQNAQVEREREAEADSHELGTLPSQMTRDVELGL